MNREFSGPLNHKTGLYRSIPLGIIKARLGLSESGSTSKLQEKVAQTLLSLLALSQPTLMGMILQLASREGKMCIS